MSFNILMVFSFHLFCERMVIDAGSFSNAILWSARYSSVMFKCMQIMFTMVP